MQRCILLVIAGSMILAFGICVEVAPDVITVPGEGIVKAIAIASKKEFGSVKICFDLSMIAIASVLSLVFFHGLHGVGIGTVITAFLTDLVICRFAILCEHRYHFAL